MNGELGMCAASDLRQINERIVSSEVESILLMAAMNKLKEEIKNYKQKQLFANPPTPLGVETTRQRGLTFSSSVPHQNCFIMGLSVFHL